MCQVFNKSLISRLSAELDGYSGWNIWGSTFLQAPFESINSDLILQGSSILMVCDLMGAAPYALVLAWMVSQTL